MKTCSHTGDKHVALFDITRFPFYTKLKKRVWRLVTLYLQTLPVFCWSNLAATSSRLLMFLSSRYHRLCSNRTNLYVS